ncbi:MAG: type III-B CRISPR module RAMP protein Cmr6 [Thermoproteota archaeon]
MIDINFESIRALNLWSYISLAGCRVMQNKAEGEEENVVEQKQRILEYTVKKAKLSNEKVIQKLENIKQALLSCGYEIRNIEIKAISLTLVGASENFGKIPFEVGLCFDPFLNAPYIPGSTIKGAVRAGVFELLVNDLKRSKEKVQVENEVESECRRLFGDNECSGLIGFTDAYPIKEGENGYIFFPDVMTPHYTEETDTELEVSPTPITYLTIAPGTVFQFYLFYKKKRGDEKERRQLNVRNSKEADLMEVPAPDIIQLGIVDRGLLLSFLKGVGAKTSVGYSKFEVIKYERV